MRWDRLLRVVLGMHLTLQCVIALWPATGLFWLVVLASHGHAVGQEQETQSELNVRPFQLDKGPSTDDSRSVLDHPTDKPTSVVLTFLLAEGTQVFLPTGKSQFAAMPLEDDAPSVSVTPGRSYRFKLANIPGRAGLVLYPRIEVPQTDRSTKAYLESNSIPIKLNEEDLDQIQTGRLVTKVYYRSDPEFRELAIAGAESLIAVKMDPGIDPSIEADRRGTILAILRIGSRDQTPIRAGTGSVSYTIAVD